MRARCQTLSFRFRNISALAPDGRLCYIAFLGGSKAEVDFLPMMVKPYHHQRLDVLSE